MNGIRKREPPGAELEIARKIQMGMLPDRFPERDEFELMGRERLHAALNRVPDADPMTLINNVRSAIGSYVKDAPQFDDLTMLCFRFRGRQ